MWREDYVLRPFYFASAMRIIPKAISSKSFWTFLKDLTILEINPDKTTQEITVIEFGLNG